MDVNYLEVKESDVQPRILEFNMGTDINFILRQIVTHSMGTKALQLVKAYEDGMNRHERNGISRHAGADRASNKF